MPKKPSLGLPSSSSRRPSPVALWLRASQARNRLRPCCFSQLRRFSPPVTLWIYFTPLPRAGFAFRGFCLSHVCQQLVAANHSLSSFCRWCLTAVAHCRQLHRIRPQGFVPCENPFRHTLVIHQYAGPIPSWFFLLQVFTRNSVPVPSHVLPPLHLVARISQ